MDITFLILFGLSVLAANAMIVGIERFANAVKDEFAKREDKKMTQKTVTLDEFLNERGDFVKQVVYKIDGDYVGDIKGENVTVILMGNGNFKGGINSKDGTVFLNKGNVIGDIKANKVLCPTNKVKPNCRMCKSYMAEGARTGQIFCYQHGLLKDAIPCSNFVKRDQL